MNYYKLYLSVFAIKSSRKIHFTVKPFVFGLYKTSEPPGVTHLWTATQEQRDWRRSSHEGSSATTRHMGSVLVN
jgi:hypothetical protein